MPDKRSTTGSKTGNKKLGGNTAPSRTAAPRKASARHDPDDEPRGRAAPMKKASGSRGMKGRGR